MTSQRKIESNRRNAKRSTGPRTALGKSRSRANALKHGLARAVPQCPDRDDDREMYESLVGPGQPSPEQHENALTVVQATREIEHIRSVRAQMAESLFAVSFVCSTLSGFVLSTERYEQRASARCRKAAKRLWNDVKLRSILQNEAKSD